MMTYHLDTIYTEQDKARVKAGFATYAVQNNVPPREEKNWIYRDENGQCIACLEMMFAGQQGYIKILWVDEAHRGNGLALKLMQQADGFARQSGLHEMWVDTHGYQAPEFYKKCGFSIVAEVPDYIAGHARLFFRKAVF